MLIQTIIENVSYYNPYGKQSGASSKSPKCKHHMTWLSHYWLYNTSKGKLNNYVKTSAALFIEAKMWK